MRNWYKVLTAISVLGFSCAAAGADAWNWSRVSMRIMQLFPLVQKQWDVQRAQPMFVEDGQFLTLPAGEHGEPPETKLPRNLLMTRLAKLNSGQRDIYLRWLVAHELWHRHQYEINSERLDPLVSDERRECEADVMGAAFAGEDELSRVSLDMSKSSQNAVHIHLFQVRDAVDPKLTDPDAGAGYPLLEQRRLATRIGVSLGLLKRLQAPALASEPGAGPTIANLVTSIMMGEDPTFDIWLDKICGRIVHDGDGMAGLRFGPATIQWHPTGDDPTVDVSQTITNTADFPIEVYLQIGTVFIDRKNRTETSRWDLVDRKEFRTRLEPGDSATLDANLDWSPASWTDIQIHPGSKSMPAVVAPGLRPGDPMVLYNAFRVP